ncbi:MFS transporter [Lactococcus lactis]|uniref:MFS transporter n=1 Tax=Lactococcus lactis TaxID=1358 RepID=UPI0024A9CF9B|nr:MFS transporter [Lactococcus lactis]
MFEILKENKNFRNFFLALNSSYIGDAIDDIAFGMLIYQITKSAFLTGLVVVIRIFFSFISIFTAALTDYWRKERVIVLSELGEFTSLLLFLIIYLFIIPPVWLIFIVVIINAGFGAFSTPAKSGLIGYILKDVEIVKARSLLFGGQNLSQIIGYTIAGLVITSLGYKTCIMIDSISFIIGIIFISKINCYNIPLKNKNRRFMREALKGINIIYKKRILILLILLSLIGNFAIAPVESMMTAYLGKYFGDINYFSLFMLFSTLSSFLGVVFISHFNKKFKNSILMMIGFGFGVVGIYSLLGKKLFLLILSAIFLGLSNVIVSTINAAMIQLNTPKEFLGRVFATFKFISLSISPLSILVVGGISSCFPLSSSFAILGILLLVSMVLSPFLSSGDKK